MEVNKQLFLEHCRLYHQMLDRAKICYHQNETARYNSRRYCLVSLIACVNRLKHVFCLYHNSEQDLTNCCRLHQKDLRIFATSLTKLFLHIFPQWTFRTPVNAVLLPLLLLTFVRSSIPTDLLKSCVDALLPPITDIVNVSLLSGDVPQTLKKQKYKM